MNFTLKNKKRINLNYQSINLRRGLCKQRLRYYVINNFLEFVEAINNIHHSKFFGSNFIIN
jgi:hypothetical protein